MEKIKSLEELKKTKQFADPSKVEGLKVQPKAIAPVSKEPRVAKAETIFEEFVKILEDDQPHTIKSLLDHFKLESTSAGREKLRACRRKINGTPGLNVQVIETRIENAKAIQLVEISATPVVAATPVEQAPVEAPAPVEQAPVEAPVQN